MKNISLLLSFILCNLALAEKISIEGYPVYDFIDFSCRTDEIFDMLLEEINSSDGSVVEKSNQLANIKEDKKKWTDLGLWNRCLLKVRDDSGRTWEVYIKKETHERLWEINPHDLRKDNLRHRIKFSAFPVTFDGVTRYKEVNVSLELVEGEPYITK